MRYFHGFESILRYRVSGLKQISNKYMTLYDTKKPNIVVSGCDPAGITPFGRELVTPFLGSNPVPHSALGGDVPSRQ
jgi:hypothetical protein